MKYLQISFILDFTNFIGLLDNLRILQIHLRSILLNLKWILIYKILK
jgi:hypothetical protein